MLMQERNVGLGRQGFELGDCVIDIGESAS